jgi:hypothetical protein
MAPAWAQECRFSSDRDANFSGTIKKVVITAGEGSLKVSGVAIGSSDDDFPQLGRAARRRRRQ